MADVTWTGETSGDYSVATNWSTGSVPTTGDNVFFTKDYSVDVTAGLNQSSVAIADFNVDGYTGKIGSKSGYLQIAPSGDVNINGLDQIYLNIGSSNIDVNVIGAASTTGTPGLMLLGSAIDDLNIIGGTVGLAFNPGETATAADLTIIGGILEIGTGCTITTANIQGGSVTTDSNIATLTLYSGTIALQKTAAVTTLNSNGGTVNYNSTGTIGTLNLAGFVDCSGSLAARTISTLAPSSGGHISYDPNVVTISAKSAPSLPIQERYTDGF